MVTLRATQPCIESKSTFSQFTELCVRLYAPPRRRTSRAIQPHDTRQAQASCHSHQPTPHTHTHALGADARTPATRHPPPGDISRERDPPPGAGPQSRRMRRAAHIRSGPGSGPQDHGFGVHNVGYGIRNGKCMSCLIVRWCSCCASPRHDNNTPEKHEELRSSVQVFDVGLISARPKAALGLLSSREVIVEPRGYTWPCWMQHGAPYGRSRGASCMCVARSTARQPLGRSTADEGCGVPRERCTGSSMLD